jgi:pimeloyl-ACP methyl ester carboxylesterase
LPSFRFYQFDDAAFGHFGAYSRSLIGSLFMKNASQISQFPLQVGENSVWRSFWCRSRDGLKLHSRHYPSISPATAVPVVCLPGLTRNSSDFHELASDIAGRKTSAREVLAMDYRGRGRSDYDSNPANYDITIEMQDVLDVMTAFGLHQAVFLGTSRGGLITMAISAARPGAIKAAILNDIGPVIEGAGLARIKSYVGKLPPPRDYADAVQLLKRIGAGHFTGLSDSEWDRFARRTFKEKDGVLIPDYDRALMKSLEAFDIEQPLPQLWPYFDGLKGVSVLSIRGANSDLFSADTQAAMQKRHPLCEIYVVEREGHAPMLWDKPAIQRIGAFLAKV